MALITPSPSLTQSVIAPGPGAPSAVIAAKAAAATKNKLEFTNLNDFCSYVQYLTADKGIFSNTTEGYKEKCSLTKYGIFEAKKAKYGDSLLLNAHKSKSSLLIDKYVLCSIPDVQLEFLFESRGIFNYNAELASPDAFKRYICEDNHVLSESFSPVIIGEHFNPYKRFQSCLSSASRSCSKILDLAGVEINNISESDPHDNVFLDIVCTFPSEIDNLLLDGKLRDFVIEKENKCRYKFFKKFESVYTYNDKSRVMGCSSNLHLWSSTIPVLPNSHCHNLIPAFSFFKNCTGFVPEYMQDLLNSVDPSLLESVCFVEYSPIRSSNGGKILYSDKKIKQKFIVDPEKYKQLRLKLSSILRKDLGFDPIVWANSKFPLDIDFIKKIWSDIVKDEFKEFDFGDSLFDVHVDFVPYYHKAKLLHKLQYKCRPPVLDLDLFFKSMKKPFVIGYDSLDFDSLFDYLYYNLEIAVKCSDIEKINQFESYINKLKTLCSNYCCNDFYEWLQFLCTWANETKVYGFWKYIKNYMLDPEHEILVEQKICPVCGGNYTSVDKVKFCIVDSVIIRHRSYFMVFNFDGG